MVTLIAISLSLLYCSCAKIEASDVPVGHLLPFGNQKAPTVIVQEYTVDDAPNPETFYKKHVNTSTPAIFRGAARQFDAFRLWTDEYMRENFGDMEVRLEGKREKSETNYPVGEKYVARDSVRHFVDTYHEEGNSVYVVSDLPRKMHHDVGVIPSLVACGEMAKSFVEIDIWWSGGKSRSVIHKDAFNQMNCLLNGTKHWKMIEYKYEKDLYKHPEQEGAVGGFSDVNVDAVDLNLHPKINNIEWSNFTMYPGDCLFLPKSYYHQVISGGTHNLAVSILFRRFDSSTSLDFSDCTDKTDYRSLRRLSEFDIMWPYNGTGQMSMGQADLEEQYRNELLQYAQQSKLNGAKVGLQQIRQIYDILPDVDVTEAFNAMDSDKDGSLSVEEAKSLTWTELRNFAGKIEPFEPSNSYEMEFYTIQYEQLVSVFRSVRSRLQKLTRGNWLKYYKMLGGIEQTGNDIYDRLGRGQEPIICKDITDEDIDHALYRWIKFRKDHPRIADVWDPSKEEEKEEEEGEQEEEGEDEENLDGEEDENYEEEWREEL